MLNIRLEIKEINYQKCVEALLPPLVEHCAAKENQNELDKFLAKLGADAAPAAHAVLEKLDTDARDQMVVWLVAEHEERLRNSANRHLAELLGNPMIRIGGLVSVDRAASRLSIQATQVRIDYAALLKSPLVMESIEQIGSENAILKGAAKLAVQMGSRMSPENLEKYCITLLNSGKVKGKLIPVLTNGLRQAGLEITVADMVVESDDAIQLPDPAGEVVIPGAFKKELMDALCRMGRY